MRDHELVSQILVIVPVPEVGKSPPPVGGGRRGLVLPALMPSILRLQEGAFEGGLGCRCEERWPRRHLRLRAVQVSNPLLNGVRSSRMLSA
jgi:hypothetical protein